MKPYGDKTMVLISGQIPLEHGKAIDEAIVKGKYKSRSEFVREAVKKVLEEQN